MKAFNERPTPILNSLKKQYESQAQTQLGTVSGTVSNTECRIQEQEQEQYLLNTNKHIPEVPEAINARLMKVFVLFLLVKIIFLRMR